MGCNHSSNQIGISPKGANAPGTAPGTPDLGTPVKQKIDRPNSKTIRVQSKSPEDGDIKQTQDDTASPYQNRLLKRRLLKQNTWTGSQESINTGNSRGGSATSKFSTHSQDSGFGGENKFITESSNPNDVQQVEQDFNEPEDLDGFGVVGVGCPRKVSAKDKARLEEQRILASLRDEGLITQPVAKATGGVSFQIVAAEPQGSGYLIARKPPVRLAKLEKRSKKKRELTEEELQAKMERAERRREERRQQKLEKIRSVTMKSDIQNALDAFAETQKDKEVEQKTKEEIAAENREKRLKEIQEKLKQKQEYAEKVRRRRKTTEEPVDFSENPPMSNKVITEDTPVGPAANS